MAEIRVECRIPWWYAAKTGLTKWPLCILLTLHKEVLYLTENSWLPDHLLTKRSVPLHLSSRLSSRSSSSLMAQLQHEVGALSQGSSHHQQIAGEKWEVPTPGSVTGTEGMRSRVPPGDCFVRPGWTGWGRGSWEPANRRKRVQEPGTWTSGLSAPHQGFQNFLHLLLLASQVTFTWLQEPRYIK